MQQWEAFCLVTALQLASSVVVRGGVEPPTFRFQAEVIEASVSAAPRSAGINRQFVRAELRIRRGGSSA
jgi:hypothetical protein